MSALQVPDRQPRMDESYGMRRDGSADPAEKGEAAYAAEGAPEPVAIVFPQGMPGFPGVSSYTLERNAAGPAFLRLRSSVEGGPTFMVMAQPAKGGDLVDVGEVSAACEAAGLDHSHTIILLVVTAARDAGEVRISVNRRAPMLVDTRRRLGFQVVLPRPDYAVRHLIAG